MIRTVENVTASIAPWPPPSRTQTRIAGKRHDGERSEQHGTAGRHAKSDQAADSGSTMTAVP
jgi:hypothetical protein